MTLLEELQWRGLYADCTDSNALAKRLAEGPATLYCGFDPTADSLHVGNLVPLLALRRFQMHGHHPIALAGGATGMVGDPSGKSAERNLQTDEQVAHNIACQKAQLAKFLDFEVKGNPARLVNNADWTAGMTYLEFLRDVGKHFTVNWMVAKESVRARMEDRENGISYTEFSYMLLQAFDFYHLRKTVNCELQVGATDQWGNITAGTELIRKKLGVPAYGLVFPLLTKADGTKYGKTAAGAVWLDPKKTSPYRFYQFFIQAEDTDVVKLLKMLTFVSPEEITALEADVKARPESRSAQRELAQVLTTLVHGESACAEAKQASEIIFDGKLAMAFVTERTLDEISSDMPTKRLSAQNFSSAGISLLALLVEAGLAPSKGQARRDVESGGIYLNTHRETDVSKAISIGSSDLLYGKYVLLRKGKRNWAMIVVEQ